MNKTSFLVDFVSSFPDLRKMETDQIFDIFFIPEKWEINLDFNGILILFWGGLKPTFYPVDVAPWLKLRSAP